MFKGIGARGAAHKGPLLVAAASFLWGTDALFRYPITETIDPIFIVFCEHLLGTLVLAAWIVALHRRQVFKLDRRGWGAAVFVGAVGSAVATALFTASFKYVNPSVAVLLQKLQPILVVAIAMVVLREKPRRGFYIWAGVALGAGVVLSFPDLNFDVFAVEQQAHFLGVAYALAASVLWAASTVAGKVLLERVSPSVGTFWRYFFGLVTLMGLLAIGKVPLAQNLEAARPVAHSILYLALFAGILPMAIYYGGLKRTSASVTTFLELIYPVSAVVLNTIVLHTPLTGVQLIAGAVLLFAVAMISK